MAHPLSWATSFIISWFLSNVLHLWPGRALHPIGYHPFRETLQLRVSGLCSLETLPSFFFPSLLIICSSERSLVSQCWKIYMFDFSAHFLMAYMKENCKCLEKSKIFLDTCSSSKWVFSNPWQEAMKRWGGIESLMIFLLNFISQLYFLSLLKLVRCILFGLSSAWDHLLEMSVVERKVRTDVLWGQALVWLKSGPATGQLTRHSLTTKAPGWILQQIYHHFLLVPFFPLASTVMKRASGAKAACFSHRVTFKCEFTPWKAWVSLSFPYFFNMVKGKYKGAWSICSADI